ncbi:6-phosphogluconolactonase [Anaerorudis cellulosivorans]|uniref:6-phosphogluconolactonase n=1 Tax=Anaerorudis cellulosivorans TaxID=3397862 RepID=UPI00221EB352|nr:6-phosphogluconolactonase [Seramator thermalis]MCW1736167.1 6-phosphogluconolactonase [Seramator thermalis]
MKIKIAEDIASLNKAFTEWMKTILSQQEEITLALSGGSTPKSLFDYWAKHHATDIDWEKIKFFWSDERCVPPTDNESNYKMAKEHLFDRIAIPEEHIFRIYGENDPEKEAKRYAEVLKREIKTVNGIPSFDILMLGMGEDGHTASIFPLQIHLWDSEELCIVGTHPITGQKRISLSGKTINAAQNVAILVAGEAKADKVKEIIESKETAQKRYPAAKVSPTSGNLVWFMDREAAKKLAAEPYSF